MFVWIDTESGTYGNAETIRIVDVTGDFDLSELSDEQIIQFGLMFGKDVKQHQGGRTKGSANGTSKYPWEKWLDGRSHKLTQGKDFNIEIPSMQASIHVAAKQRGLYVSTGQTAEGVLTVKSRTTKKK